MELYLETSPRFKRVVPVRWLRERVRMRRPTDTCTLLRGKLLNVHSHGQVFLLNAVPLDKIGPQNLQCKTHSSQSNRTWCRKSRNHRKSSFQKSETHFICCIDEVFFDSTAYLILQHVPVSTTTCTEGVFYIRAYGVATWRPTKYETTKRITTPSATEHYQARAYT